MNFQTDVIVIGSGYGGSVVAARTAQAGLRVVVLERGGQLDAAGWDAITEGRANLRRSSNDNGPLDVHVMRGLGALTGNGMGGGSRINTGVTIRPPAFIFDQHWPRGVDLASLAACYYRIDAEIRPVTCSESTPRVALMNRLGRDLKWPVTRLPLAVNMSQAQSVDTQAANSESLIGSVASWFRGAGVKRGLDQTYLRAANEAGGIIQSNTMARVIEPLSGGFRVHFRTDHGEGSMTAKTVVVAAGTLNTVRLLFANRDEHVTLPRVSPRLGERFFTNGDRGALLYGVDHDWSVDHAPTVTSWFDLWDPHRFFIMDLGRVPIPGTVNAWILGVMGANESPRRLIHRGNGRLRCTSEKTNTSRDDEVQSCIGAIAKAASATWMMVPAWLERRMPMTVHPLGGAVMADTPARGVADSHGEVFGHSGLFIADGSLVPTPTGVPPSMTIAALAERVATRVVESMR